MWICRSCGFVVSLQQTHNKLKRMEFGPNCRFIAPKFVVPDY